VQSTHKVLGAMTQAAMLHTRGARVDPDRVSRALQVKQNACTPEAHRPNFSMCQSGADLKCPYSNRPLKPFTRLIGLWQGLFSGTWDLGIPLLI
jgi:hypothetical protein